MYWFRFTNNIIKSKGSNFTKLKGLNSNFKIVEGLKPEADVINSILFILRNLIPFNNQLD